MTCELIHCVYASAASRDFAAHELAELLTAARANNARLGLTGMLLHAAGSFFQVIEGPADVVDALYARIEHDPRHTLVTLIIREPIPQRRFADWSMGFQAATPDELATMAGVNNFFDQHAGAIRVDAGRAMKLLGAFRDGRWRTRRADSARTTEA